jgi:hypothetical protein
MECKKCIMWVQDRIIVDPKYPQSDILLPKGACLNDQHRGRLGTCTTTSPETRCSVGSVDRSDF